MTQTTAGPPGHVDLNEAAKLAGCHRHTVLRAIEAGTLSSVKLPSIYKHWLDERAVREWAANRNTLRGDRR